MRSFFLMALVLVWLFVLPLPSYATEDLVEKGETIIAVAEKKVVSTTPETEEEPKVKLTEDEIITGLKEILKIGTEKAVAKLAKKDGFRADLSVRISLPESLDNVRPAMEKIGQIALVDKFELRMNRTAEKVTPKVAGYFILAINQLKVKDAEKILNGTNSTATEYLKDKMFYGLSKATRPIIKKDMKRSGAYRSYESMMDQYRRIPFEPRRHARIEDYMVKEIVDALFLYIAQEEQLIRINPEMRTTEAVQKIFP